MCKLVRVLRPHWITRADVKANPDTIYLFGDNKLRKGLGGQAAEMRGEPNTIGIRTKNAPGVLEEDYFNDKDLAANKNMIDDDIVEVLVAMLVHKRSIAYAHAGIGAGLAQLPERAPLTYQHLQDRLKLLETSAKLANLMNEEEQHDRG